MPSGRPGRQQAALLLAAAAGLLWLVYLLSPILTPFLLGATLAYICNPLVQRLERYRVPRALGTTLLILFMGGVIALLVLILAPMVIEEAGQLSERLPDLSRVINDELAPWLKERFGIRVKLDPASLRKIVTENWDSAQNVAGGVFKSIKAGGMAIFGVLGMMALLPVVMFYLLRDWDGLLARIEILLPRPWHAHAVRIAREVDQVLAEFLRGQLSVMLILAIYYSLALWLAGLDFALPVGILTGLLIFIPYVGYGLGLVLALLVAMLQFDGWNPIIGVAVVYAIGQGLESFLLTPFLVGERVGLHPVAVIFALLAFGQLFGFVGVLIALPTSAALLVGLREIRAVYLQSALYQGHRET